MSAGTLPVLLICLAVTVSGAAATDLQCRGRPTSPLCEVSGQLAAACPEGATSLALRFSSLKDSWPADGGLRDCSSVSRLKVTGWGGPELTSGHLRQLGGLAYADIVDGGLQTVGGNVSTAGLAELSLARNKIHSLHALAFTECGSLASLDLSDNSIAQLPDRFLINCRQLRTLRLTGNRLQELRPEALLGADNLRELLMQRNRFQLLHLVELGFINSPQLSLIDLRNNGLFSYQAGRRGFCGPANVTVRMHFGGCPPQVSDTCSAAETVRSECVGTSAQLVVTFTSCQVSIGCQRGSTAQKSTPAAMTTAPQTTLRTTLSHVTSTATSTSKSSEPTHTTTGAKVPTLPAVSTPTQPDVHSLLMRSLGLYPDGVWLLWALGVMSLVSLLLLIVSLCACHRLKLRIATLQARGEPLLPRGDPSLRNFNTLYSQSVMSGRATPSGKDQSSHCGDFEIDDLSPPCDNDQQRMEMLDRDGNAAVGASSC